MNKPITDIEAFPYEGICGKCGNYAHKLNKWYLCEKCISYGVKPLYTFIPEPTKTQIEKFIRLRTHE